MVSPHLTRYREIAETLSRHGLGVLLGASGLERRVALPRSLTRMAHRGHAYSTAEHVRLALEELGPTFVKLGQLLSTRPDLLPAAYLVELARLQDSLSPIPGPVIQSLVEQELGGSLDQLFASFDLVPLASASIGQAHAATMLDGTEVVVKVRRPGAVERIEEDLEILQNFAAQADRRWVEAADYDLPGLAGEFARTLRGELDYLAEGRNAERFAENFAGHLSVHIPRVYWEATTTRVLTLERLGGLKVSNLPALDQAGINRPALAARAASVAAQMIFDDGFFHADPHPGNLFIEADGRIGLIDFGMVGVVDTELREQLGTLLLALTRKDPHRIAAALARLASAPPSTDLSAMAADMVPVIELYSGRALREVSVGKLIREVLSVVRRRHLQLPHEVSLLLKMVLMTEGMGVSLDPDFQLGEVIGPYAQRLVTNRYSPTAVAHHLAEAGVDALELVTLLPGQIRRLQAMLDSGGPEVHFRAAELEPLISRVEVLVRRVVIGAVAATVLRGLGEAAYLGWTSRRKR